MCPLGAISEWLHGLGRRLGIPNIRVAHRADRVLALLKYVVLAAILTATWRAGELVFRGFDPCYALISRHGADITYWAYVVAGAIAAASLVIVTPFCRWLCPFAAVLNPLARFGLSRIKRNVDVCRDCGLCSEDCPAAIPVDRLEQVTAARCISCMNCMDACPQNRADRGALEWGPPKPFGRSWSQATLIAVLLLCTTAAVGASYIFPVPSFVKSHGSPAAQLAKVRLKVENLTCRGRANLFFYFLERDDLYQLPGYFKVEAWPGPGVADVDVTFDPTVTDEDAIKQAITEPYYDAVADFWRNSPFRIEGYDPLAIEGDEFGSVPGLP
jgi:ferredoxin